MLFIRVIEIFISEISKSVEVSPLPQEWGGRGCHYKMGLMASPLHYYRKLKISSVRLSSLLSNFAVPEKCPHHGPLLEVLPCSSPLSR